MCRLRLTRATPGLLPATRERSTLISAVKGARLRLGWSSRLPEDPSGAGCTFCPWADLLAAKFANVSKLFLSCLSNCQFLKEPLFKSNSVSTLAKLKTSVQPPERTSFIMIYTWEREPCQETHNLCPMLIIAVWRQGPLHEIMLYSWIFWKEKINKRQPLTSHKQEWVDVDGQQIWWVTPGKHRVLSPSRRQTACELLWSHIGEGSVVLLIT